MIELDTIFNQDCLVGLKALPDKSIDLILTDPPYGKKLTREPMALEPPKIVVMRVVGIRKPPPKRCSMKCSELPKI